MPEGMQAFQFTEISVSPWLVDPAAYDRFVDEGINDAMHGRVEEAITAFNKSLEINSKNALARYNRARSYFEKGQFDQAIVDFDKAIELKPDLAEAYNNSGCAHLKRGKLRLAIERFSEAIKLGYADGKTFLNRGVARGIDGAYRTAIDDFTKAIELLGDDKAAYEAFYNRGVSLARASKELEALDDYTKAIELNQSYAPAYYNRGVIYLDYEKIDLAISDFTRAIEIDPRNAAAFYNRASAYFHHTDETDLAIADYTSYVRIVPGDAEALFWRGAAWANKREFGYALVDWAAAGKINRHFLGIASSSINYYKTSPNAALDRKEALAIFKAVRNFLELNKSIFDAAETGPRGNRRKGKKEGAGRTEIPATSNLDRETRWATLGLPEVPTNLWKPRSRGRPASGLDYEKTLIEFIRKTYGPYLKSKTLAERQEIRAYIFNKDNALYRTILDYERRKDLPRDVFMPSDQFMTSKRLEKLQRHGVDSLTPPERKSVNAKARRLEAQQKPKQ